MKLPLSFGNRLFLRLLIPGTVAALGLLPVLLWLDQYLGTNIGAFVVFGVSTLAMGWLFSLFDMSIYMLFEGRRFWPSWLRKRRTRRQQARVDDWLRRATELDELGDRTGAIEYRVRAYRYPIGGGAHPPTSGVPAAMMPTELGNVIYGYETYSTVKYGMDGMFFWDRIWVISDSNLRSSFDEEQALCDSAIYSCFASLLNFVLFALYGLMEVSFLNPVHWNYSTYLALALVSLFFSFVMYRAAITANAQFGEKLKALFDVYVDKVPLQAPLTAIQKKTGTQYSEGYDSDRTQAAWRYLRWHRYKAFPGAESKDIEEVAKTRRTP